MFWQKKNQLKCHWKYPKEWGKKLHLNTSHNSPPCITFCAWKCPGDSRGRTAHVMLEMAAGLTLAHRTASQVTRFRGMVRHPLPVYTPFRPTAVPNSKITYVRVLDSWFNQKACPYSCPTSLPILQALCTVCKGGELLEVKQCRCHGICQGLT